MSATVLLAGELPGRSVNSCSSAIEMAESGAAAAVDASPAVSGFAVKRSSRGPGFKPEESLALVRAWKLITMDPIVGSDQAGSKFWGRVHSQYCEEISGKALFDRTSQSLESHWGVLSREVQKFAGILNQLMNNLKSGENEQSALEEATKRYFLQLKKHFKFMEAYRLLQSCPKFILLERSSNVGQTKDNNAAAENDSSFKTPDRPIGQAPAKKRRSQGSHLDEGSFAERSKRITDAAEKMAGAAEDRRRLAEERNMLMFFEQDPQSAESKEFFKIKRLQYLNKLKQSLSLE